MTPNVDDFTVPEKILLAADTLDQSGQSPFSAEALIVASWQKFPKTFGLKGYTELYPDSNKILSSIMGEKGLAKRGWLVKMGQKLYALTREGRGVARRVKGAPAAGLRPHLTLRAAPGFSRESRKLRGRQPVPAGESAANRVTLGVAQAGRTEFREHWRGPAQGF